MGLRRVFRIIIDFIAQLLGYLWPSQYGYLPAITDPLLLKPATVLVDQIKSGKLKSEQVIRAYIKRIKQVDPHINAVIDECYEQAIEEAKRVDDAIEKALRAPNDPESVSLLSKPLLGIPITGKDCSAIKGLRFTAGVPGRKNVVADEDSTLAKMLRDAGGIPICMTNVPECLIFWDTFNKSFGRTHNPYNKNAIPGGSSGGLGALIASGASLIGLGSDIGGSIRMPAGFCGLYGHCCSVESVPIDHHWPPCAPSRKKMLSYGPITRYVQDIRSLLRVYTSQSEHNFNFDKPVVDMKKLKVYYLLEINDESLTKTDEEIKKGIMRVVDKLRSEGAQVREAKIKSFDSAFELWMYKMRAKDANPLAFEMNNREGLVNLYTELAKCLVGLSSHTLAVITTAIYQDLAASLTKDTQQLERNYQALFQEVADLLDDDSVLILPSHPEIEVKPPGCYLKFKNTCYTGVFNTLRLTMTQVPIGLSKKGHPMGMQIIGKHLNDNLTLSVAEFLDSAGYAGWVPPTKVVV